MMIKNLIEETPQLLTIIPSHKCTASCDQCCFGCTPNIQHRMSYETIVEYINQAIENFPTLKALVVSGGECFLLGNDLVKVVKYAASRNLFVRVVSNGYWANTYEDALKRLKPLKEVGLTEINFSTGDNHQQYVKFENIVNGVVASADLGIKPICISVESPPNACFKSEQVKNHEQLAQLIKDGILLVIDAAWMNFKKSDAQPLKHTFNVPFQKNKPCGNLYNNITISPYSQLLACCGLTVEYNEYLKLGSLEEHTMKELYEQQFDDLFKFWLYVDGPKSIYDLVSNVRKTEAKWFPHDCAYCMELSRDKENVPIIRELLQEQLPSIIFRYKMRNSKLIV